MELVNATRFEAGFTQGLRVDGREWLVVVIKGTYVLPASGQAATLAEEQQPLVEADEFHGEPGFSAPRLESDYAPIKPRCDVILNGSAYAPQGKPATRVSVGLRVGEVSKVFDVVGDRQWEAGATGIGAGFATPFTCKTISYDVAFGGTDRFSEDPAKHDAFMRNPSGIGYRKGLTTGPINGTPMPNTEERGDPITSPLGEYVPMSFGPVARAWQPRCRHGGTYDQAWLDDVFPFLPQDFDDRYFQCAPEDQQTEHLAGGEQVTLVNLTPDGHRQFSVPAETLPVYFIRADGERVEAQPVIDTLSLEPDADRFSMTWRTHLPLRRNMLEIAQVVVGDPPRTWWRAKAEGKPYYAGLADAVRAADGIYGDTM